MVSGNHYPEDIEELLILDLTDHPLDLRTCLVSPDALPGQLFFRSVCIKNARNMQRIPVLFSLLGEKIFVYLVHPEILDRFLKK